MRLRIGSVAASLSVVILAGTQIACGAVQQDWLRQEDFEACIQGTPAPGWNAATWQYVGAGGVMHGHKSLVVDPSLATNEAPRWIATSLATPTNGTATLFLDCRLEGAASATVQLVRGGHSLAILRLGAICTASGSDWNKGWTTFGTVAQGVWFRIAAELPLEPGAMPEGRTRFRVRRDRLVGAQWLEGEWTEVPFPAAERYWKVTDGKRLTSAFHRNFELRVYRPSGKFLIDNVLVLHSHESSQRGRTE